MWYNQHEIPIKQYNAMINRRIEDIALQKYNTDISTSLMCRMYRLFFSNDFDYYLLHSNCGYFFHITYNI